MSGLLHTFPERPTSADILKAVNTGQAMIMQEALRVQNTHGGLKNIYLYIKVKY